MEWTTVIKGLSCLCEGKDKPKDCPCEWRSGEHTCDWNVAKAAIDLAKKQEPIKPVIDIARNRRCPRCFTILKGKYCHECGQGVLWNV